MLQPLAQDSSGDTEVQLHARHYLISTKWNTHFMINVGVLL